MLFPSIKMQPVKMWDGSPLDDDSLSWWYEEDEKEVVISKRLAYIMDFTQHFPYWEELRPPKGYNSIVKVDEVWYWTFFSNN